jgi:hypothetical protein
VHVQSTGHPQGHVARARSASKSTTVTARRAVIIQPRVRNRRRGSFTFDYPPPSLPAATVPIAGSPRGYGEVSPLGGERAAAALVGDDGSAPTLTDGRLSAINGKRIDAQTHLRFL